MADVIMFIFLRVTIVCSLELIKILTVSGMNVHPMALKKFTGEVR